VNTENRDDSIVDASLGPPGALVAGADEVDITPHLDLPMAGYSAVAKTAVGVSGRLFARALFLRDARGEPAAVCVADIMSGTRYLLERVAQLTAATCGITTDRLLLIGTHTHTGPAWIYGNSLYDQFATHTPGFDPGLCDWLAHRIAGAIERAAGRARPARVAIGEERVWGLSRNRSLPAFRADPRAASWNAPGAPGAEPPAALRDEQRAVDPRLRIIATYAVDGGSPIAAFAFFGAHFTSVGSEADYYSADCAGYAVRKARWDIERAFGADGTVVAVAPSVAGNVNTLRDGLDPELRPGPQLARWVGIRLGRAVAAGVNRVQDEAEAVSIESRYLEPIRERTPPGGGADTELASRWAFGAPTLAGSEESRTFLYHVGLAREPMTDNQFPPDHPQHPKARGLGFLQIILAELLDLDPCPVMPIHQLWLGRHVLATVPGEPTVFAGREIEEDLLAAGAASALVIGYTGDYGGYFTTRAEYETQHYEGSSTLFGRNATTCLARWHRHLGSLPERPPFNRGPIEFDTGKKRKEFRPYSKAAATDPEPSVRRNGTLVEVRWRMRKESRVLFAEGYFVRVEQETDAGWAPLAFMGRDYDDVHHVIHLRRTRPTGLGDLFGFLSRHENWAARFFLPGEAVAARRPLRVRVAARHEFPGFVAPIPD
jgi:neutral ceramidase